MTFKELQKICENKFGTSKLADIALELGVTPQVVSNWKARDTVPYKYVKKVRKKQYPSNDPASLELKNFSSKQFNFDNGDSLDNNNGFRVLYSNLIDLKNGIQKNLILFLSIPFLIIFITLFKVIKLDPIFISEAKIIPAMSSGSSSSSQLQSIAANFGVSTGGPASGSITSAALFPEVIRSRRLARTLLKRKFNTDKYGKNIDLLTILTKGDSTGNKDELIKNGILKLQKSVHVISYAPKTPLIAIRVSAFEPKLAADLASAVVDELNKLQKYYKSQKNLEKKAFISERISDVEKQLTMAEENLKFFRESNRAIFQSPTLQLEQERLLRDVSTLMQVYLTLKSQFELVQIELFDGSNMVEILDNPEAPLYRTGPRRKIIMFTAFAFSFLFSTVVVFFKNWFERNIYN